MGLVSDDDSATALRPPKPLDVSILSSGAGPREPPLTLIAGSFSGVRLRGMMSLIGEWFAASYFMTRSFPCTTVPEIHQA